MGQPYVGEIRMFAGNFAPVGWAFCNGQTLSIAENDVLFNLIGTTYGGDGQQTFQLPDLQGRLPVHQGNLNGGSTYVIGERAGVETVTLTQNTIPVHNHGVIASGDAATDSVPNQKFLAAPGNVQLYSASTPNHAMNSLALTPIGGNQPHENMQPYLCISFIISLFGVFPSQG